MNSSLVTPWLREHYAAVDANEFEKVGARFADEIEVRFGNRPPARGREQVAATLADVHAPFRNSVHRFLDVWEQGHRTLIAFEVDYHLNDGSEVTIETFTILDLQDGLIKRMRVYIDEGALRGA